jgi:uncharacterized phosphatase
VVHLNQPLTEIKIALVRHGETDWNVKGLIQGQSDIPLNKTGLIQSEQTADWLAGNGKWDRLYSSHLMRAQKTAEIIGNRLNLDPIMHQDLMERKFGALEGLSAEERENLYPDRLQNESSVPGLEYRIDFTARVLKTFQGIVNEAVDLNVIIVAHGGWINQLLYHLSDGKIGSGVTTLENGSICLISKNDEFRWNIVEVNIGRYSV